PPLGAVGAAASTPLQLPEPRLARGPQAPALAAPAAAAGSVVIHAPITIHAEGRSAQELAQLVRQQLRDLLAQHHRRTAALYD
ncbi:MAG: hypothetical protein N2690_12570, partial [Rhodocyclaceae bacterium]|nr:hypothetical protein [Rhodocyclaceae bacterium]